MPYHNQVVPDEWREPIGEWLGVQRAAGLSPETIKTKRCEIGHVAKGVNASAGEGHGAAVGGVFRCANVVEQLAQGISGDVPDVLRVVSVDRRPAG